MVAEPKIIAYLIRKEKNTDMSEGIKRETRPFNQDKHPQYLTIAGCIAHGNRALKIDDWRSSQYSERRREASLTRLRCIEHTKDIFARGRTLIIASITISTITSQPPSFEANAWRQQDLLSYSQHFIYQSFLVVCSQFKSYIKR